MRAGSREKEREYHIAHFYTSLQYTEWWFSELFANHILHMLTHRF